MRVALINTRIEQRQHIPMGLLYLAAYIEDISEVKIFDPEPDDIALQDILAFNADIIGITSMTQNWPRSKELIDIIRSGESQPKIVVGGIHSTVCGEEVINTPGVDAICTGEGEDWLKEYIQNAPDNGGDIAPGQTDLKTIPLPAYHLMPQIERYIESSSSIRGTKTRSINIMTSRGCPGGCIYCSSKAIFGLKVRRRTVESVIEEIKLVKEKYDANHISFTDDTFPLDEDWVIRFCKEVEPLDIKWSCQARADSLTEDGVFWMKKSGCVQIDVGVESGSRRVLKILKKGESPDDFIRVYALLKKHGVRRLATFVIGTPGETEEDILETKKLLKIIKPDFTQIFYLTPYPGTKLQKMCYDNGIKFSISTYGIQDRPVIENPNISPERYAEIRRELYNVVWWQNIRGYLKLSTFLWFIKNLRPAILKRFLLTWKDKNLYDAMYGFLQDTRKKSL
ncbi:B12-binding domain-containing radical SAM protein [Candidatus Latescibacterota bacterium]